MNPARPQLGVSLFFRDIVPQLWIPLGWIGVLTGFQSNRWAVSGDPGPGFLKEPASSGSLGLQSLVPCPKSLNSKKFLGALSFQKKCLGVRSCQKMSLAFLVVKKSLWQSKIPKSKQSQNPKSQNPKIQNPKIPKSKNPQIPKSPNPTIPKSPNQKSQKTKIPKSKNLKIQESKNPNTQHPKIP